MIIFVDPDCGIELDWPPPILNVQPYTTLGQYGIYILSQTSWEAVREEETEATILIVTNIEDDTFTIMDQSGNTYMKINQQDLYKIVKEMIYYPSEVEQHLLPFEGTRVDVYYLEGASKVTYDNNWIYAIVDKTLYLYDRSQFTGRDYYDLRKANRCATLESEAFVKSNLVIDVEPCRHGYVVLSGKTLTLITRDHKYQFTSDHLMLDPRFILYRVTDFTYLIDDSEITDVSCILYLLDSQTARLHKAKFSLNHLNMISEVADVPESDTSFPTHTFIPYD